MDPKLGRLIDAVIAAAGRQNLPDFEASPFEALVRAVIYQSIAAKAAEAIYHRLKEKLGGKLRPAKIVALTSKQIGAVGLSTSKARTIRELATWFATNRKTARQLPTMSDEDVVITLTSIAGIGAWTVNVFLIFNLRRPDVMPAVDLGLRRGVQLIYGLKDIATAKEVQAAAETWRPYRSIGFLQYVRAYTWHVALCTTSLIHQSQMMTTKQVRPHGACASSNLGRSGWILMTAQSIEPALPFAWVAERGKFSALCSSTLVKPWARES